MPLFTWGSLVAQTVKNLPAMQEPWVRFLGLEVSLEKGDSSKVQCCKEKYCIGTWKVRFMNQGKLAVVKHDGKSEHQHSRNQRTKMGWNGKRNIA